MTLSELAVAVWSPLSGFNSRTCSLGGNISTTSALLRRRKKVSMPAHSARRSPYVVSPRPTRSTSSWYLSETFCYWYDCIFMCVLM